MDSTEKGLIIAASGAALVVTALAIYTATYRYMLAKHVDPLMHKIIDNSRRLLSVVSPEAAHAVASPLASPPQKKQKAVKTNARIVIAPSPVTVSATPPPLKKEKKQQKKKKAASTSVVPVVGPSETSVSAVSSGPIQSSSKWSQ
eukprot:gene17465-22201_t